MNWTLIIVVLVVFVTFFVLKRLSFVSAAVAQKYLREGALVIDVRSPEEFGFVHLDHSERVPDCAGINHSSELIGEAVIDLIVAQIHRGETGIPRHAMTTVVEGYWVPGKSVAMVAAASAAT